MRTQRHHPGRLMIALAVAVPLCIVAPPARGMMMRSHKPNRNIQQQILQVEEELRTALIAGDSAGMDKYLADDFVGISSSGKLSNKQQYLRRVSRHENVFSAIDVLDRKVRLQPPSTAVVITTANVTGTLESVPAHGIFRYTRVYNRQANGAWKVVNSEAIRVSGPMGNDDMHGGVPVTR